MTPTHSRLQRQRAARRRARHPLGFASAYVLATALILALIAAAPVSAYTVAVPRATYSFAAPGGESLTFTVSADSTVVTSYDITAIGHEAGGKSCDFHAEGDAGDWEGATIINDSFEYSLRNQVIFHGKFTGAQSAAGTFTLYDPPIGSTPACETGTLKWTAKTTTRPSSLTTSDGGKRHAKPVYRPGLTLREVAPAKFVGQITATAAGCRADRTVTVWINAKAAFTTRSRANGSFSFPASSAMAGQQYVRASIGAHTLAKASCAAGTSQFVVT